MMAGILAIGWDAFLQVALMVVFALVWGIMHFARMKPNELGQPRPPRPGQPPQGQPAGDPLQAEIDEFLRKAQALREGRPQQRDMPQAPQPQAAPAGATRRPRPQRRGTPRREEPRPPAAPVVVEVVEATRQQHESVAQHVAQHMGGMKFEKRETRLSQMQEESDSEFSKHMDRVFSHDVAAFKGPTTSIFGAAVAAQAPAAAASVADSALRSATAPVVVRKAASDVAVFLANRANVRDAIILNEILRRPEDRW